jgi:hypothetical protein
VQHYSCEWIRIRHSAQNFGFIECTVRNSLIIRLLPKYNACTYTSDVSSGGRELQTVFNIRIYIKLIKMIRIRRKGWICNPGYNRCFNNSAGATYANFYRCRHVTSSKPKCWVWMILMLQGKNFKALSRTRRGRKKKQVTGASDLHHFQTILFLWHSRFKQSKANI